MSIPYYVVVSGRGYWRPTKSMRAKGFTIIRCGPDGPAAWRIAADWNERWQRFRRAGALDPLPTAPALFGPDAIEAAIVYPKGALGEAFARYRRTEAWSEKKPRTREDWWRGWKRIRPIFGDLDPASVTLEDISAWRATLIETVGVREAHRATKIWRALWKVAAALHYCERQADPSLGVRNRAAKGRSAVWREGEVVRLIKAAWRADYKGLAAIMAVMWDTQMSPVDARSLVAEQLVQRDGRAVYFTDRAKTGVAVTGVLSRRAAAVVAAYVAALGYTPLPNTPLFRSKGLPESTAKGGRPRPGTRYSKDMLSEDFAVVRALAFGQNERRQLQDFRRSGAVEAIAGGIGAEELSRAMGNSLSTSNVLFDTYAPADPAMAEDVAEARVAGRNKIRKMERIGTKKYQNAGRV